MCLGGFVAVSVGLYLILKVGGEKNTQIGTYMVIIGAAMLLMFVLCCCWPTYCVDDDWDYD